MTQVHNWFRKKDCPVFRLFGYAGTGKTTLAREFAEAVDGPVWFAAYTGKAALVMRQHGCPGATTLHRLIYVPSGRCHKTLQELEGQLTQLLQEPSPDPVRVAQLQRLIHEEGKRVSKPCFHLNPDSPVRDAALVVIDECSMVDAQMGHDLLLFGVPVIALGDPAQLPPVRGGGFFTDAQPDFMLTQIHRQAEDNPIVQLATAVRSGSPLSPGRYGASEVLHKGTRLRPYAEKADQIIVGRNATRQKINASFRHYVLGHTTPLPQSGERLVCLRNNHKLGILNGELFTVVESTSHTESEVFLSLNSDEGQPVTCTASAHPFLGQEAPWWSAGKLESFDYGYALTCHKSQGSQWERVLVVDESASFGVAANSWLYTAITRASKQLTIIQQ